MSHLGRRDPSGWWLTGFACSWAGGLSLAACIWWNAPTGPIVICALATTVMVWLPQRSWNRVIAGACLAGALVLAVEYSQAYGHVTGGAWTFHTSMGTMDFWVDPHLSDLHMRLVLFGTQNGRNTLRSGVTSAPIWLPITVLLVHPVLYGLLALSRRRRKVRVNQTTNG
jgi:hypothetical protein